MTLSPPLARVAVLVEGPSDVAALRVVARARGLSEDDGHFSAVSLGGVTNIGPSLATWLEQPAVDVVSGLCDAGEERFFIRALERQGVPARSRQEMAEAGFFVCEADLEDELLRAVGTEAAVGAVDALGDLGRFRTFQQQPEWRDRGVHDQLHRFAGVRSGRKALLAAQLASMLAPSDVPAPLAGLLDYVETHAS